MPDHTGPRQRPSDGALDRVAVLAAALIAVVWLLVLPEPRRPAPPPPRPVVAQPSAPVVPPWSGPAPVRVSAVLPDGSSYRPRIFLPTGASVGVTDGIDGSQRLVRVAGSGSTVLRTVAAGAPTQYDGFAVSGDTLVWAESVARPAATVRTTLWQVNWRTGTSARQLTTTTGEVGFAGSQYDIVLHEGRAYWTAAGTGTAPRTEVRSVALTGGRVSVRTVTGEYALTGWPWLVSAGGRGVAVTLRHLETDELVSVPTQSDEVVACAAAWCRVGTLGGAGLVTLDLERPDGSLRRRVAGADATPAIVDVVLLDRYVPLTMDRTDAGVVGARLAVYDIDRERIEVVAEDAANVQGRDGVLWWSSGEGAGMTWQALDLRTVA